MSISLPNGTILSAPSSSAPVSAAVTRILHLANFPAELKTRDLQAMFKEWESEKGGFRIKWVDDVNALVVFADATVAKRAYLSLLLSPPPALPPPASIRPYDRPDAAQIIASLAARTMGHRSSMSSALTSSSLANIIQPEPSHSRAMSMSTTSGSVSGGGVGGLNGFTMPLNAKRGAGGGVPARGGVHHRAGSASSSWSRQSMGAGVLNFSMPTSSSIPRLPTHSEGSSVDPSRSSSTSEREEPTIVMDSSMPRTGTKLGAIDAGGRRESVTADKALREVEKALASVETQG